MLVAIKDGARVTRPNVFDLFLVGYICYLLCKDASLIPTIVN